MISLGYSADEVEEMCYGIAIHVDDRTDFEGKRAPFTVTVGDADNIDRFDAYRLYEGLHFNDYMNLPIEKQRIFVKSRLSKLSEIINMPCGTKPEKKCGKKKSIIR